MPSERARVCVCVRVQRARANAQYCMSARERAPKTIKLPTRRRCVVRKVFAAAAAAANIIDIDDYYDDDDEFWACRRPSLARGRCARALALYASLALARTREHAARFFRVCAQCVCVCVHRPHSHALMVCFGRARAPVKPCTPTGSNSLSLSLSLSAGRQVHAVAVAYARNVHFGRARAKGVRIHKRACCYAALIVATRKPHEWRRCILAQSSHSRIAAAKLSSPPPPQCSQLAA